MGSKRKVRVYVKNADINMLQEGGPVAMGQPQQPMQPQGGDQMQQAMQQVMQMIQQMAQQGADPMQIAQTLMQQGVPPEAVGQALVQSGMPEEQVQQVMVQVTQGNATPPQAQQPQGQPSPEEMAMMQQQQQGQPGPQAPMPPMADGGYIDAYAKKIKALQHKKVGGMTDGETHDTVQKKHKVMINNAIGSNFANNMIDNAGDRFAVRAKQGHFQVGGGFENPFMASYDAALNDAYREEYQGEQRCGQALAESTGMFDRHDVLKAKGITPEGEKIRGKWNIYDEDPGMVARSGGQLPLPSFQEDGEVKYVEGVSPEWQRPITNPFNLNLTATTVTDASEEATYYDNKPKPGDEGYDKWISGKVRGDWSNAFEGAKLDSMETKYGIFGAPNPEKGKKGRIKKQTMHFRYGDTPTDSPINSSPAGTPGNNKPQWDYNNFDDLRGMLEADMDLSLDPSLSEDELFRMAKEQGLVGQAATEESNLNDGSEEDVVEQDNSDIDDKGRLLYETQQLQNRRDKKWDKRLRRESRRSGRREDRANNAYFDAYGEFPGGNSSAVPVVGDQEGLEAFEAYRERLAGTPIYRGGGTTLPMFQEEGEFDPYLDMTLKEDKLSIDAQKAGFLGMAGANRLADMVNTAEAESNASTAYLASLQNPTSVGNRGSFGATTGAPTFQRDKQMGFTGGRYGAGLPEEYDGNAYYGRDGGSMGYDMNQPVYMDDIEIEYILKNGGKVEYY